VIGYDFWEMDALPYDSHPINSGFFVQRHGTRSASLLLREAPGVELVPYRYPRPDMSRMQALVEHSEVLQLDPRWSATRIGETLREAYRILAQCGIAPGDVSSYAIRADDYLLDLSTGSARSLLEAAGVRQPAVVFARETRMAQAYLGEAFGIGNTTRRPWLANSVWLMLDVDDAGIALAHELYHVLANSGAHVEDRPNLMQPDTRPESTELTPQQCRLAQLTAVANGLLKRDRE